MKTEHYLNDEIVDPQAAAENLIKGYTIENMMHVFTSYSTILIKLQHLSIRL